MLNLLGILFEQTTTPAGVVTLTFSGGATIRLEVECVDAQLRDLGARWKTRNKPGHADVDAQRIPSGSGAGPQGDQEPV
jgi:hypothetical protein